MARPSAERCPLEDTHRWHLPKISTLTVTDLVCFRNKCWEGTAEWVTWYGRRQKLLRSLVTLDFIPAHRGFITADNEYSELHRSTIFLFSLEKLTVESGFKNRWAAAFVTEAWKIRGRKGGGMTASNISWRQKIGTQISYYIHIYLHVYSYIYI